MKEIKKQNLRPKRTWLRIAGVFVIIAGVGTGLFFKLTHKAPKISGASVVPTAFASDIPGWWLKDNFGSSVCTKDNCKSDADPDNDKLTNSQEYYYHTDPLKSDTNKNGLSDGDDVAAGYDPSKPGKVTFDQAASDDSVVGESLVFDKDIKQMFAQEINPDNVKIPEPDPSLIKTSDDNSIASLNDYFNKAQKAVQKYFPENYNDYIQTATTTQNASMIADIQSNSIKVEQGLSELTVPTQALTLHKYFLTFFQLLPQVVKIPSEQEIGNMTDTQANYWYDQTQAFMLLQQKIELEQNRLSKL